MSDRPYRVNDIQAVMERVGSWATSWDDVLAWLQVEGVDQTFLSHDDTLKALLHDVSELKIQGEPYHSDYRVVWHRLTGQGNAMQPPVDAKVRSVR